MERYRKAITACILTFLSCSFLMLFLENGLVPEDQRLLYLLTKLLVTLPAIPLLFWLRRDVTAATPNILVALCAYTYTMQGQWFRPYYFLALFQITVALAFLFPLSRRAFRILTVYGVIGYLAVLYFKWDQYVQQTQNPKFGDVAIGIVVISTIGMFANSFFTADRIFREHTQKKFVQIGKHTARIVHDLKNLISAPRLYVDFLQARVAAEDTKSLQALDLLSRDLDSLKQIIMELNQISVNRAPGTAVSVAENVEALRAILKSQLQGVTLECHTELRVACNSGGLSFILMNLILNSVQIGRLRGVNDLKITIESEGSCLRIRDNAGGFDNDVLSRIQRGVFDISRTGGSGLGLSFVFDEVKEMGGAVGLANTGDGAEVWLVFPKKFMC